MDYIAITEQDLFEAQDRCQKAGEAWKELINTETAYYERGKDLLAALKMEVMKASDKISDAKAENIARAMPRWEAFRKLYFEKLREAGRAKIEYQEAIRLWDTVRSALALKRSEVQRIS